MFKVYIFCFILFLTSFIAKAQVKTPQQRLDSLLLLNQSHPKEDSMKVVILKEIYRQYIRLKNTAKVEEFVFRTIVMAQKTNQKNYEAEAFYRFGLYHHTFANYQKAEEYYTKAIEKFIALKDLDWVAGIYLNMGEMYYRIPDYAKGLEVNQKAIAIYLKTGNEIDLASCYTNVAGIYQDLGQQDNALFYLKKALKIFSQAGEDTRGVAVVYNTIGRAYFTASSDELIKMGVEPSQKNEISLESFTKALRIAKIINDNGVQGVANKNLGGVYEAMGQRGLALKAYEKSVEHNKKEDNSREYGFSLLALGDFYEQDNNYSKSREFLLEALNIGQLNKLLELQRNAYLSLSKVEEKQKNFNQSLNYYRQYILFKDQIFNQEKEKEITRRQLQIDFSVKEKDYQLKQQVTDGELQRQVLLARQQQQKLVLRQQELTLSDQEKSLQRLTFLKRQADLENEKRAQGDVLKQQKLKAALKDKEISLQRTELRVNRNINIFLGVLAAVLFASALFVFYAQHRTAKLNKIVSEQKLELEKLGKVKDRIFSLVSHDMRTPVNSLISFIQLLEGGNISQEKLTRYAANLKNTLGYTSAMMENLLNWASSQMEGYRPILEKFDAELCARDVINSLQIGANEKNIKIENKIKSGILCLADMNMTSLVLRNLISNSIKFTANNGWIKVNAIQTESHILLNITDNGRGLSQSQLLMFNQPGNQEIGESTLGTNRERGTGIGLVLCKTFTGLMNGSLEVVSKQNEGSTFTLQLPKAT
ncbi:tetratricopeptide repeat-containing sensor histidine kinase [Pedobacter sp. Hv1]|uniref:tetratricopeptide repeat-containing sensor histidine kinase n=1 Tax=Pedobacter sp. Hv1 TaxID=1740090 RepID=UPI0006D8CF42|nr:tetratricopeptide repeat-containing sensor histidine kinase [Pedobacter sp. Hv1]KQC00691.1 hypothetical protein AQF98_08405 [Pedobacter sp. Hv1]